MIAVEVDDHGAARALVGLARSIAYGLRDTWRQIGVEAIDQATPFVPVLAGRLVGSLLSSPGVAGVEVSSDLIYAGVQDIGWPARNIRGHHFMAEVAESIDAEAPRELENEIQALARRAGLT